MVCVPAEILWQDPQTCLPQVEKGTFKSFFWSTLSLSWVFITACSEALPAWSVLSTVLSWDWIRYSPFHATFNTEFLSICHHSGSQHRATRGSGVEEDRPRFHGSQHRLSQSVDGVHGAAGPLACVPRGWVLRLRALLNTEQRCVQGCWKLHETVYYEHFVFNNLEETVLFFGFAFTSWWKCGRTKT